MNVELLETLPPQWPEDLTASIRQSLVSSGRTIVVLDDDPTGTQTVYDVPVLTRFDGEQIENALAQSPPVLFLLTNSRSMTAEQSKRLHTEITARLKSAAAKTDRQIEIISRSDSTLRGHYPLETDVLSERWPQQAELVLIMPFFLEGGRLTINGQHFVKEGDRLTPAHKTPFAKDLVFGFENSFMPRYIEEKTNGRVKPEQVITIPINVIREQGPNGVLQILDRAPSGSVCVADGVTDSDAQVVAAAVGMSSKKILARVAASYVRARAGLARRPLLSFHDLATEGQGGLVVVGSHVPKSTAQLNHLLENQSSCIAVELDVSEIVDAAQPAITKALGQVQSGLESNQDVILFTSRELITGGNDEANLKISQAVSSSLVAIVNRLTIRPRYLVAKGGITSSDIATDGLGVERAMVAGSILPGVPVWQLGEESKFPGMHYVIFPGNVGDDDAVSQAVAKLKVN